MPNALAGVLSGLAAGSAAGIALGLWLLRDSLQLRIEPKKLKRMLLFSLPLVPASVAIFLSTYTGRFILNDLLTLRDVGLFTWASQIAGIPVLLLLGVQGAVTPLVMKHHQEPETPAVLARSFETIFAAALWLCVALGLFTPELIRLLGYAAYAGAGPLVIILAPALLLLQLYVFAPGFALAERTGLQLLVSILGAVAAVIFNYAFVSAIGLSGAALATLGSSAVFMGSWFAMSQRLYPVPARWLALAVLSGASAACALVGMHMGAGGLIEAMALKAVLLGVLGAIAASLGFFHMGRLRAIAGELYSSRRAAAE
jgi:O-antigen/teichoic acid export membrane protein